MEKGGASFFYHADGLGSITELTDNVGAVAQAYTYSSFGKIESQLDPTFIQPYTFTSREFDPEAGLYFYRHRTPDPSTGRFNQEDPILHRGNPLISYRLTSLLDHPQRLHSYPYVGNGPVNFVDPYGLLRWWPPPSIITGGLCKAVGATAGAVLGAGIGGATGTAIGFGLGLAGGAAIAGITGNPLVGAVAGLQAGEAAASVLAPLGSVVGGIIGANLGGRLGSLCDDPCAGKLNCEEAPPPQPTPPSPPSNPSPMCG